MADNIGSIKARLELSTEKFEQGTKRAKRQMEDLSKEAKITARSFDNLDTALAGLGAGTAFVGMSAAIKATVNEASKLQMSMQGLIEVSKALGQSVDQTTKLAEDLASKGFMTVAESADAVKTSLTMGLGLEETEKLIMATANAAAFNREKHLEWGEAINNVIRGIKSGNSELTDAAGITTNLSTMYDRYARTIGTTAGKLTEAQKVQAAYNGMLQEAELFAGNADKALDGYQGSLAKYNASIKDMKSEIGESLLPVLAETMEILTPIITSIAKWAEENPKLVVSISGLTLGVTGLITALAAAVFAVNTLKASLVPLAAIIGPAGWLVVGVGAVTGGLIYLIENTKNATQSFIENRDKAEKLASEYDTLKQKASLTKDEKARLVTIMNELKSVAPEVAAAIASEGEALDSATGKLRENTRAWLENRAAKLRGTIATAESDLEWWGGREGNMAKANIDAAKTKIELTQKELNTVQSELAKIYGEAMKGQGYGGGGRRSVADIWASIDKITNLNTDTDTDDDEDGDDDDEGTTTTTIPSYSAPKKTPAQVAAEMYRKETGQVDHWRSLELISPEQEIEKLNKMLGTYKRYEDLRREIVERRFRLQRQLEEEAAQESMQTTREKFQFSSEWIQAEEQRMTLNGATEKEIAQMKLDAWERIRKRYEKDSDYYKTAERNLMNVKIEMMRIEEREARETQEQIRKEYEDTKREVERNLKDLTSDFKDELKQQEQAELDSLDRRKKEIEDHYDEQLKALDESEYQEEMKSLEDEIQKYKHATSKDGIKHYEELLERQKQMERDKLREQLREERDSKLNALSQERSDVKDHYDSLTTEVEEFNGGRISSFSSANESILEELKGFVTKYNEELEKIKLAEPQQPKQGQPSGGSSGGSSEVEAYDPALGYQGPGNYDFGNGDIRTYNTEDAYLHGDEDDPPAHTFHTGRNAITGETFKSGDRLLPDEISSILQKSEFVFQPQQLNDLLGATKGGGQSVVNNYNAPLIQSGDTKIEDDVDASTYWRERELAAQRLMSGGDR